MRFLWLVAAAFVALGSAHDAPPACSAYSSLSACMRNRSCYWHMLPMSMDPDMRKAGGNMLMEMKGECRKRKRM